MTTITFDITDQARIAGLAAAVAAHNATIPVASGEEEQQPPLTDSEYLALVLGPVLDSYATQHGVGKCTGLQALRALEASGLRAVFDAWSADEARTPEEKAWAGYAYWEFSNPIIQSGAASLGLTQEQLWGLFQLARTL